MTRSPSTVAPPLADASIADLVRQASAQVSALIRDEVSLAKVEMTSKARSAGVGVGMLGVAGVLAVYGLGGLLVCAGLAIALVLPGWLAALTIGGFLVILAGIMALAGLFSLRRATPPVPASAIAGLRADVHDVAGALHRSPDQTSPGRAARDGGYPSTDGWGSSRARSSRRVRSSDGPHPSRGDSRKGDLSSSGSTRSHSQSPPMTGGPR